MPHFQKRGNRIRAGDKSPVFRFSAGLLLLLFFGAVLLLNLKTIAATDWKSVHAALSPSKASKDDSGKRVV